jgi:hypothetical protein
VFGAGDDAARAAARKIGYEGVSAYTAGDYSTAVDKLGRAYGIVRVPTLGLWYARALAKTGKLLEASERFREVIKLDLTEGQVKEQKKAQEEAEADLQAVLPRIPMVTIQLVDGGQGATVAIDGLPMDPTLVGLETPANPGSHRVRAERNGLVREAEFELAEGEKKTIELELSSAVGAVSKSSAKGQKSTGSPARSGSAQKTWGWISIGLGGAATLVGVATGVMAMSKRASLDSSVGCVDTRCPPARHDELSTYNSLRSASTIGFIVGGVGLGTGAVLLFTSPKSTSERVGAWVGPASAGVWGTFR